MSGTGGGATIQIDQHSNSAAQRLQPLEGTVIEDEAPAHLNGGSYVQS